MDSIWFVNNILYESLKYLLYIVYPFLDGEYFGIKRTARNIFITQTIFFCVRVHSSGGKEIFFHAYPPDISAIFFIEIIKKLYILKFLIDI